jgi:hypothetical protein
MALVRVLVAQRPECCVEVFVEPVLPHVIVKTEVRYCVPDTECVTVRDGPGRVSLRLPEASHTHQNGSGVHRGSFARLCRRLAAVLR